MAPLSEGKDAVAGTARAGADVRDTGPVRPSCIDSLNNTTRRPQSIWLGQGNCEDRKSGGDQKVPRSSPAAGRGRDARVQTLRRGASATSIAEPEGNKLTQDPSPTRGGREAGLHPVRCHSRPADQTLDILRLETSSARRVRRPAAQCQGKRRNPPQSFLLTGFEFNNSNG